MIDDERLILDKARENIQATDLLISQGFFDIAASRSYYAMFYIAEALLLRRGSTSPVILPSLQPMAKNMPKPEI